MPKPDKSEERRIHLLLLSKKKREESGFVFTERKENPLEAKLKNISKTIEDIEYALQTEKNAYNRVVYKYRLGNLEKERKYLISRLEKQDPTARSYTSFVPPRYDPRRVDSNFRHAWNVNRALQRGQPIPRR